MPECERLENCSFFQGRMSGMESVANLLKEQYCLGDKKTCARYMVAVAGLPVPPDMLPADEARAKFFLASRFNK